MSHTTTQENNRKAFGIIVLAALFIVASAIVYFQASVNPEIANAQIAEMKALLIKLVAGCLFMVGIISLTDKSIINMFKSDALLSNKRLTKLQ